MGGGTHFSTDEQIVGTWVNNKPIYQKTIYCGSLPDNSSKTIQHGVSNIDIYINLWGYAQSSTGNGAFVPFAYPYGTTEGFIGLWTEDKNSFIFNAGPNRSNMTLYVTFQYTKTMD